MGREYFTSLAPLALLVGCTDGLAVEYDSKQEVIIEGVPHVVFTMVAGKDNYQAREKSWMGGAIDPNDYRQNILAIEAVSGCEVDMGTVTNQGLVTTASVNCNE